jgi:RNA polymerase sigma-70 factor (ECF subfamily)
VQTTADADDHRDRFEGSDDHGLLAACRAGSRAAFGVLVERHRRQVYRLCYRFAGTHEDAADLSQEVFLRAYRAVARFRGDSSVSTWLHRIGVNVCLNRAASRRPPQVPLEHIPELAAPAPDPASSLAASERAAIAALPEKQRATVILRVYQELSHREIAEALGTTEGAAKANLFHALRSLRRRLAART